MNKNSRKVFLAICLVLISQWGFSQGRIGTLEEVKQDDGYLVIAGLRIAYRADVEITYRNEEVSTVILSPGLRVSYTLHLDGSIKTINLLGPVSRLEGIDQH